MNITVNGHEFEWGYEYDDEYAACEGEDAVGVILYTHDDDVTVLDSIGGVTLDSLTISDHGNVIVSPEDEAYLRTLAEELARSYASDLDGHAVTIKVGDVSNYDVTCTCGFVCHVASLDKEFVAGVAADHLIERFPT